MIKLTYIPNPIGSLFGKRSSFVDDYGTARYYQVTTSVFLGKHVITNVMGDVLSELTRAKVSLTECMSFLLFDGGSGKVTRSAHPVMDGKWRMLYFAGWELKELIPFHYSCVKDSKNVADIRIFYQGILRKMSIMVYDDKDVIPAITVAFALYSLGTRKYR